MLRRDGCKRAAANIMTRRQADTSVRLQIFDRECRFGSEALHVRSGEGATARRLQACGGKCAVGRQQRACGGEYAAANGCKLTAANELRRVDVGGAALAGGEQRHGGVAAAIMPRRFCVGEAAESLLSGTTVAEQMVLLDMVKVLLDGAHILPPKYKFPIKTP